MPGLSSGPLIQILILDYFLSVDFFSEEVGAEAVGLAEIGTGGAGRPLIWRGPLP
jgi:hypothetical protein